MPKKQQSMSSETIALQIKTDRFINTEVRAGCNIPCDLHLEHWNQRIKGIISRMESKVKPATLDKSIGIVVEICVSFCHEIGINKDSHNHAKLLYVMDYEYIHDVLSEKFFIISQ